MSDLASTVKQAQSGDIAAFAALVRRFQDMAMGYAHAILHDYHQAQDAAQEAFIEAHAGLPTLDHPLAFPNWLRRIVFKHCNRMTRGKDSVKIVSTEVALELVARGKSPAEIVEEDEVSKLLHEALDQLSKEERQIVSLYYMSDQSQKEVADFLGIKVDTVKNRLRTARGQLKERLLFMVEGNLQENRPSRDESFVDQVLRLVAPQKTKHSEDIYALFDALGRPDLGEMGRAGRIADSKHDWKTSRVGFVGDQIATYYGVYDLTVRVGTARVRAAGENLCYTHPDYGERFGELMDQTVAAALEAMRDQGYDLVINLAGREYARYGYVPVWRCEEWRVETAELPREAPDFELQPFAPTHREDLAAVYNDTNETLTGTTVRPTYFKNKEPGGFQGWLWTDDKGRPRGYVTGGDGGKDVYVDEHAGPADEVLQALALIARRGAHDTVRFRGLPYNSPVGQKLRQLPSCSIEWVGPPLVYFARIVNLQSLFENLVPELSRRLRAFPLVQWEGDLLISTGDEEVALRIKGADVSVVATGETAHAIRGGQGIVQLALGTDTPEDVVERNGIQLSGDAEQLIKILFPAQYPMFGNQDL